LTGLIDGIMNQANPRNSARTFASKLLRDVGIDPETQSTPVSLSAIARRLGVVVVHSPGPPDRRYNGVLRDVENYQKSLLGDPIAEITAHGLTRKFALAHELIHRATRLYLPKDFSAQWSPVQWRSFLDEAAGRLLLPDRLLLTNIPSKKPITLTIELIESASRDDRVSISCFLKRLKDVEFEGKLRLANCALVVATDVSLRKKINYAPRIRIACHPRMLFIPSNVRLSTVGLNMLSNVFLNAIPFRKGLLEDSITMWKRSGWEKRKFDTTFNYVVYRLEESNQRILLTTFNLPSEDL